jgi:hypothetical protein
MPQIFKPLWNNFSMNKRVVPTSAAESNGTVCSDHHILKCNADTANVAIICLTTPTTSNVNGHTAVCDVEIGCLRLIKSIHFHSSPKDWSQDSSDRIATRLRTRQTGVRIPVGGMRFNFSKTPRPALSPNKPHILWVTEFFPGGKVACA